MGYGSTYDHYQIFRISSGKVVEHLSMERAEFKRYRAQKFAAWQQTPRFRTEYDRLLADDWEHDDIIDFMQAFWAEQYLSE